MKRPQFNHSNENAQRELGVDTKKSEYFIVEYDVAKAWLQAGRDIRVIDAKPEDRPKLLGILATLRDELPVRCTWTTVREKHTSETRLRARRYWLPGEFLRVEVLDA